MARPLVSAAADGYYDELAAYQDGDRENGYLLLALCQAASVIRRPVDEVLRHDDTGSGLRRLHSPSRAPARAVARLRDLAGVQDTGQSTGQLRAEIADRPRVRRATMPGLLADVLRTLAPGADVRGIRVVENVDGDALHTLVLTLPADTVDPAATLRAVKRHEVLYGLIEHQIDGSPALGEWARGLGDTDAGLGDMTTQDVS